MNTQALHAKAKAAAAHHDRLTSRVESEAGQRGISILKVRLADAARERIRAENALAAAQEAMKS